MKRSSCIVLVILIACGSSTQQVERQSVAPATPKTPTEANIAVSAAGETTAVYPVKPAVSPEQVAAMVAEGMALLRASNIAEGREKLQKAVETGLAEPVVYYNLAVSELLLGDKTGASVHCKKAVELSGGSYKAIELLFSLMKDQPDLLASFLEELAEKQPDAFYIKLGLARARISQGRPADALREATELLRKDEANIDVMKVIARAYMAMGRVEAAQFVLSQALEIRKDAEVLDLLGLMALKTGDTAKALAIFLQAVEIDPMLADAHNNIGTIYHEMGDEESAISAFQAALKVDPGYSVAWMNLGNALKKSGRFEEAIEAYKRALKNDPSCVDCYFNLGVAELENKGLGKDEPGHYRRAIEYFSQYRQLRGMRRDEEAEKYLNEARRMAEMLEKEEARPKEAPQETPETVETPQPSQNEGQ